MPHVHDAGIQPVEDGWTRSLAYDRGDAVPGCSRLPLLLRREMCRCNCEHHYCTASLVQNNNRSESYSACVHAVTPNPRSTKRPLNARPLSMRKVNDCRSNGSPNGPM